MRRQVTVEWFSAMTVTVRGHTITTKSSIKDSNSRMAEFMAFSVDVSGHANNELVGTWKLVSATSTMPTGERGESPYGTHPAGFLTYTAEGRVTALISYDGRKSLSFGGGTPEEQAEAFKTFLAYAGSFTLRGDRVTHHIEISSIQNYVGKDLVRSVKFQGDFIILVTPPTPVNGKIKTVELVWQRLLPASR